MEAHGEQSAEIVDGSDEPEVEAHRLDAIDFGEDEEDPGEQEPDATDG